MVMISVKQKNNFSQSISREHVVITDFWTLTDNNEIQLPSNMEIICNNYLKSLKLMYQKITLNSSWKNLSCENCGCSELLIIRWKTVVYPMKR